MALSDANSSAALATTGLLAAGGDEVSAAIASLFSVHGQGHQQVAAQMTAFHDRFVQALTAGAGAYAHAEAANASPLQTLEQDVLGVINAPTQALLGRPLIGDGAAGTATHPTEQTADCCSATAASATTTAPPPPWPAATAAAPG